MNDITAIDFAVLRTQEKLRAKRNRLLRQEKENSINEVVIDDVQAECEQSKVKKEESSSQIQKQGEEEEEVVTGKIHSPSLQTPTSINNIQPYKIKSKLSNVYYIPQCLNDNSIQILTKWMQSLPKTSNNQNNEKDYHGKWTRLKHAQRNVALFDLNDNDDNNTQLLQQLSKLLIQIDAFSPSHPPNHVLINEYQPQEGIMPHTDGPLYYPKTATFSIGGNVLFQFRKRNNINNDTGHDHNIAGAQEKQVMQIMLSGKGSLIVFDDDAYINHCHSINDRLLTPTGCTNNSNSGVVEYANETCVNLDHGTIVEREHRYSLTFRHKYKTSTTSK